jgi:hypothetical protein
MMNEEDQTQSAHGLGTVRSTAVAFAQSHGVTGREVVEIIAKYAIEPEKEPSGAITYSVDDLVHYFAKYGEDTRKRGQDNDLEFFRRLFPDLKNALVDAIREVLKQELTYAVAIRDTKESMLIELMGYMKAATRETRSSVAFLTRLAAQINLAAVSGVASGVMTEGVRGQTASLGVDVDAHGLGLASISEASLKHVDLDDGQTIETNKKTTGKNKSGKTTEVGKASKQPVHKDLKGGLQKDSGPMTNVDSDLEDAACSPLFAAMFPKKYLSNAAVAAPVNKHMLLLEEILQMADLDIQRLNNDEKFALDEVLAPWDKMISDLPKFTSFYGSFSSLQRWIADKSSDVPLLIIFLAINRKVPGTIGGSDFMDMVAIL